MVQQLNIYLLIVSLIRIYLFTFIYLGTYICNFSLIATFTSEVHIPGLDSQIDRDVGFYYLTENLWRH